ncbi:MAG: AAA family ATPase [Acutalibacter sp.]|jgi:MoxR-like ATPase
MLQNKALAVVSEVRRAIVGKDTVICKALMAILARGHILLEDNPGVGKTTLALAFSKTMGLAYNRVQFTPEVMPADVVGFSVWDNNTGDFTYRPGAVLCNLFLADEINRTSAKTQSALLEAMEEGQVTVDNVSRPLPQPFTVIATQNPVGSAGTQLLPESQLDRFMMRLSIGYPTLEQEVEILKQTEGSRPVDSLRQITSLEEVLQMQQETAAVHVSDDLYRYVASLSAATREHPLLRLGASPRAGGALVRASRASAWLAGRDYVIPADVRLLYYNVLEHRVVPDPQARLSGKDAHTLLTEVLDSVPQPKVV